MIPFQVKIKLPHFVVGQQLIDHYVVTAGAQQTAGTPFATTVEAQDVLNVTVAADSSTLVTMSSSSLFWFLMFSSP